MEKDRRQRVSTYSQANIDPEITQNVQVNFTENQMIITYKNLEKTYFIKAE